MNPIPPFQSSPSRLKPIVAAVFALFGAPAMAATLTVNSNADSVISTGCLPPAIGTCTLKGALATAANGDTIVFAPSLSGQTIVVTPDPANNASFPGNTGLRVAGKSVTMDARNLAQKPTLQGSGGRLFHVAGDASLSLKGLRLTAGQALGGTGGRSFNDGGSGGGGAGLGGAILSEGTLVLDDVQLSGNSATGGAGYYDNDKLGWAGGGGGGGGTYEDGLSTSTQTGGSGGSFGGAMGGSEDASGAPGGFGGGGGGGFGAQGGTGHAGGGGGFGGGGGGSGAGEGTIAGGLGGFGGGNGGTGAYSSAGGGGGGAGLGGAIFVKGGTLGMSRVSFESNAAQGGAGASSGQGYGGAVFVYTSDLSPDDKAPSANIISACEVTFKSNVDYNDTKVNTADIHWSNGAGGQQDTSYLSQTCPPTWEITATASPVEGGKVVCTPGLVENGGNVTCEAVPAPDYLFAGWGDACAGQDTNICTLSNVTGPANVLASFTFNDGDGVADGVENGVPTPGGGKSGDGNGDGTLDSLQDNVTSLPTAVGGGYATVVTGAGVLVQVEALPTPVEVPANAAMPYGAFAINVSGLPVSNPGAAAPIEVLVPRNPAINAYLKRNLGTGTWDNIATAIDHDAVAGKTRIRFTLADGGPYDSDLGINGAIADPGGPAIVAAAPVPVFSPLGLALLPGLMGMGAWLRRRRDKAAG